MHFYKSRLLLSVASTPHCHSFAYSIFNFHSCARLRCKQAGLLLLALRWPLCLSTGVLGSGPAFCCPPIRLIGGIPKFAHVSQYMLNVLHWLPAEQRIPYRIASLVWRCLVGLAPVYLRELCCPPLSAMSSRSLRSSQQGLLLVPFARTSTKEMGALSVVGPSTWNGLPPELRIFNRTTSPAFFLTLRLLCLTVLVLGALLSSFLEEALYKCSI